MICETLLLLILGGAQAPAAAASPKSEVRISKAPSAADAEDDARDLNSIRRVYVEAFKGGAAADHLREQLIASIQRMKLFVVTEDEDQADAVLKGSAQADSYKTVHSGSENLHSGVSGSTSRSTTTGGRLYTRDQNSSSSNRNASGSETYRIEERQQEASAAVRLVAKGGDVLWSTSQESNGAKFRSASADVAERIARQLAADWRRSKREQGVSPE